MPIQKLAGTLASSIENSAEIVSRTTAATRFIGALLLLMSGTGVCAEQDQSDAHWQFTQFQWENDDIFFQFSEEAGDRFYTNGLKFSWGKKGVSNWTFKVPFRKYFMREGWGYSSSFAVGQNFYTPEVLTISEPQPFDRPWAGYLYLAFGTEFVPKNQRSRHLFEWHVGVTGPASGAKLIQSEWHRLPFIDAPVPRGWHNQFDNEYGINLFYNYDKIVYKAEKRGVEWDVVPSLSAAAGSFRTELGGGITLRLGKNISSFPYNPIQSTVHILSASIPGDSGGLELLERASDIKSTAGGSKHSNDDIEYYLFVGGTSRLIGHNHFLEGSLFRNDDGVEPQRHVWESRIGFRYRCKKNVFTYTVIRRGPEFDRVPGADNGIHNFSSLSYSRAF